MNRLHFYNFWRSPVRNEFRQSRPTRRTDDHVGARMRLRRILLGMTQEQLAGTLAISYQQVQKYETGANRISAGRLFEIAERLGVDVGYFFEGLDPDVLPPSLPHGGRNRIAIDLVRNFLEISSEDQRSALANLVKTLKATSDTQKENVHAHST
ncbi:MAG: helix-turn-helix transcriptional regulator [Proteobacteria bacterium]|nr:helix-turn-helix transcriptional regulator [Pseudomonadota bacterium]